MSDNNWTKKMENTAVLCGKLSQSYYQLHTMSIHYYRTLYRIIGIISIVLCSIVSVGIFVLLNDEFNVFWFILINAIFSTISTGITGIKEFMGFADTAYAHKEVAVEFHMIYEKITIQLNLSPKCRKDAQIFFGKTLAKFNSALVKAPSIRRKYINILKAQWINDSTFDITALRQIDIEPSTPNKSSRSANNITLSLPNQNRDDNDIEDIEDKEVDTLAAYQLNKLFSKH